MKFDKNKSRAIGSVLVAVAFLMISTACLAASTLPAFGPQSVPQEPDYSKATSWASTPSNPDQYAVDIFWVYPTVLQDDVHWLMDITAAEMQKKVHGTITKQASVFTGQANLYAPYYRQMNMNALTLPDEEVDKIGGYGKSDVSRAFDYYLKHYNNGRPFVLAGHSQGCMALAELMVKKWGSFGIEDKLIAAYIIGWGITDKDLANNHALKMCASASQTGCIISYNTVADGKQKVAPTVISGAVVVNPLTWTIDDALAPASMNLGAAIFAEEGVHQTFPGFTSAQAKDYGLVVAPKDPSLIDMDSETFPKGVYHVFDYSLFYENLKANAAQRIQAYLNKK
ncbi:DUF3089 domain-containing protein [Desulfovibrio ferrophilus]|uniref:DUF3089 domain-containing protein n=1 Tax=Desulfovibrio ferrophilus TaxID=241368 RepID=A0A2Z6B388_9BACT|nr:DUF3089 domain-containing protein [Desulfovibrio ferrophilus]BBD09880.1 uncharacterized protein DFE_3154 [Desulfovibrio ferrophilus]